MSDHMDSKLRELTYRLVAMAPEAPPFPEESMVQLKPSPTSVPVVRRRSPLVLVGAAAFVVILIVGAPLILLRGGNEPSPSTIPPATQTTVPDEVTPTTMAPTTVPTVTAAPTTAAPTAGDGPTYLSAGFDAMRGSGYYPGRIVTVSPLAVSVGTDADAAVTVNGVSVTLDGNGGAAVDVDLAEGENTIVVTATRGGQTVEETLVVRYSPDVTIEFTYLTQVSTDEIVADFAQWLTGDDADQAAFEDGVIASVDEGVPNDFYIRNVNPQLRTLALAGDVAVVLINPLEITPVDVSADEWVSLFKPDGTPWDYDVDDVPSFPEPYFDYYGANVVQAPYWLYLGADGTVIQIEQQYLP